jgi:hypothetical protein
MSHFSQFFTGETTHYLTIPYGVSAYTFACFGGGGCGGHVNDGYVGGGGGGGCSIKTGVTYRGGAILQINTGLGGISTGITSGGTSSIVDIITICSATGGFGVESNIVSGATGGIGVVGDFLYSGGNGSDARPDLGYSGAGGGGAGMGNNGTNANIITAGAGGLLFGGAGGDGRSGDTSSNGRNALNYGGGGGGAIDPPPFSITDYYGGQGGLGAVYISYYFPENMLMNTITSFAKVPPPI